MPRPKRGLTKPKPKAKSTERKKPQSPADAYFRGVFSIAAVAEQLVRFAMPAEVLAQVDLSTLSLAPDSFVNADLRKSLSDLIYTCRLKNGGMARICLLFEHKSHLPGRLIYPQMHRYLCGIQEDDVKQKRKHFTLTVPILFYHGAKKWNLRPLSAMYGPLPTDLSRFIPAFDILVVDLQKMSRQEMLAMQRTMVLRNIFLAMKNKWDDNFFKSHTNEFIIFADENMGEDILSYLLDATWGYIQNVTTLKEEDIMEALTAAAATAPPKYRAKPKTLYQQLQEKYRRERQEGIQEGRQEATDTAIKKVMLNLPTFTDTQIALMFELPLERIQQLRAELKSEQPEQGTA